MQTLQEYQEILKRMDPVQEQFENALFLEKDLKRAKKLLEKGANINGTGREQIKFPYNSFGTPLGDACYQGLKNTVVFLLENGADLNIAGTLGLTPLLIACSGGGKKGEEIALKLIDAGADITYTRKSDEMTALKFASGNNLYRIIEILLKKGVPVDGPNNTEQTALMHAARNNSIESIKILVEYGADINRKCGLDWSNGATAKGLAKMEGKRKSVKILNELENNIQNP